MQECKAVSTVIFRVQGPDLVDLLYAGTDQELWGCKLLQVLMSFLQVKWKEVAPCCAIVFQLLCIAAGQSTGIQHLACLKHLLHSLTMITVAMLHLLLLSREHMLLFILLCFCCKAELHSCLCTS